MKGERVNLYLNQGYLHVGAFNEFNWTKRETSLNTVMSGCDQHPRSKNVNTFSITCT